MRQEGLEAALAATQARVEATQREAAAATRELKKAHAAAAVGQVRDLRRAFAAAVEAAQAVAEAGKAAEASYSFDEGEHVASGAYRDHHTRTQPPLPSTVDVQRRVAGKHAHHVREMLDAASALAAGQARPPKGRPEAPLESLVAAYELLAARDGRSDPLRLDALRNRL